MPRAQAELARVMPGVRLIPYPVIDNNAHLDAGGPIRHHQAAAVRISEIFAGDGRLGATDLVRQVLTGGNVVWPNCPSRSGPRPMARSLLFNVLFYVTTTTFVVIGSPLLFAPRRWAMAALALHARFELWLLKTIVGTKLEVRGAEKLPEGAAGRRKHQSAWETFALIPLFRDPAMLMKRELFWIPFHGWFSHKFEMIPVDRDKGPAALRRMLREAKKRVADGREIIIFPEGTRRAPGAPPDYKTGVALLYESLGVPCLPVALNSGLFWPRRSLRRHPGTIVVEFLDPIPPGLPKAEFLQRLADAIEGASAGFWPKQRPRNPASGSPLTFECLMGTGERSTFVPKFGTRLEFVTPNPFAACYWLTAGILCGCAKLS